MATYLESHESCFTYKFLFASLETGNAYYPVIEEMDKSKDEISALLLVKNKFKNSFGSSLT